MDPLLKKINEVTRKLRQRDRETLRRVTELYLEAYDGLRPDIERFARLISEEEISGTEAMKYPETVAMIVAVTGAMNRYARRLEQELLSIRLSEIERANEDFWALIQEQEGYHDLALAGLLEEVGEDEVIASRSFLRDNAPLILFLISRYGRFVAEKLVAQIILGVYRGISPRELARRLRRGLGAGLGETLKMVRTWSFWAYRGAQNVLFWKNREHIVGWVWWAVLDNRTCMSCVNMHGSFHLPSESLDDHPNGRCSEVPITRQQAEEWGVDTEGLVDPPFETGYEWFMGQDEQTQREMMGEGRYNAWTAGLFTFGMLSRRYVDDVWGSMLREATLGELLGQ